MSNSDVSSVHAVVASVSRVAALVGTYFSIVGIFLVARIPWIERRIGHDRLVTWHRKLGPWSFYLIGFHVLFIVLSFAGQDQVSLAVEMWRIGIPLGRSLRQNLRVEKIVVGTGCYLGCYEGAKTHRTSCRRWVVLWLALCF